MNGGVVIKAARLRAGLSQRALAKHAGTTQNALSRWERGLVEPGLQTVAAIVAACGLELRIGLAEPDPQSAALHAAAAALTPRERLDLSARWADLRARARIVA